MADYEQETIPEEKKSGCATAAKIFGIGCLILIILGTIAGIYIAKNFKKFAAGAAEYVFVEGIKESDMPDDQKEEFIRHIKRVAVAYKDGNITDEQLEEVLKKLSDGPLIPMMMTASADNKYVKPSGLSEEEKTRGTLDLQRFGRGVVEKSIPDTDVQEIMNMVSETDAEGDQQLKETLTDDEVKAFLQKVREKADTAKVPEESFEINPAEEFGKAIDEALKEETTEESNQ